MFHLKPKPSPPQSTGRVTPGNDGVATNLVDAQITRLREKLALPGRASLIHTVRRVGYAMADQPLGDRVPLGSR